MEITVIYLTQTLVPKDNDYPGAMPIRAVVEQAYHQHFRGQEVEPLDWDKLLVTNLQGETVPVDVKIQDVNFAGSHTLLVVLREDGGGGEAPTAVLLDPRVAQAKLQQQFSLIEAASAGRGWNVKRLTYPEAVIEVMPNVGLRIRARNYDFEPPAFTLVDMQTEAVLPMPEIVNRIGHRVAYLLDGHPVTGEPFFCVQGFWEYHEHPGHLNDPWLPLRNRYSLFSRVDLVDRLLRGGQLGQREGLR